MPLIGNWRIKNINHCQLPIGNTLNKMAGGTTSILLKNFTEKDHVLLEKYLQEHSITNEKRTHFWDIHTAHKKVKPHGKNKDLRPFIIEFHPKKSEFDDDPNNQTLIKN